MDMFLEHLTTHPDNALFDRVEKWVVPARAIDSDEYISAVIVMDRFSFSEATQGWHQGQTTTQRL